MSLLVKKLKVLHVVDLSKTGGVEVMFMDFLSKVILLQPNIEHEVFAIRINQERKDILLALGIKSYLPENNRYNLLRRLKIIKIMSVNQYDIVHGQNYSGNLWAAIGKIFQVRKFKLISHEHGGSWGAEGLLRAMSKFWVRNSELVICNSNAAATIIRGKISKKANLQVIYNGVRRSNLKIPVAKSKTHFSILFVGRLVEVKGIKELVYALKILNDQKIEFICNILGDGELKYWLSQYIKDNDLSDKVTICGIVNNVDQYMANSDILVLPSFREPLGNVIIEAAQQRLPVIASEVDGIIDIVKHCDTGILLKPRFVCNLSKLPKQVVNKHGKLVPPMAIDPNELALEIIQLIENPEKCKLLGLQAQDLLKDYTIERYSNAILEVYLTS